MPAPSLFRSWLLACVLAVIAVALAGLLVLRRTALPSRAEPSPTTEDASVCGLPPFESVRARPDAEGPPVILWASGAVRLYLDDEAAFSSPEAPRHYDVGDHTLRVEAEGHDPISLTVHFDPWTPALLHAEVDPEAGLILLRLNAACVSCPLPSAHFQDIEVHPSQGPGDHRLEAAVALREGDWPTALRALEQVPPEQRETPLFLRLASVVFVDMRETGLARDLLRDLTDERGEELQPLLDRQLALFEEEEARKLEVQLYRWNRATERYGALVERHGAELPRTTGTAGSRLEELSTSFSSFHDKGDVLGAEEALRAAEDELLRLARRLSAARPGDCAFQADVVRMATTG